MHPPRRPSPGLPPSRAVLPLLLLALVAFLAAGCVSDRYKPASSHTPPADILNLNLGAKPVELTLVSVITYNGPGSWKRDAFWDEFVISFHNPSPDTPAVIHSMDLEDLLGNRCRAGTDPWELEHDSKTKEQRYREAGVAFVRYTAPLVTILGVGSVAVLGTGLFTSTSLAVANATVVAIPVYYLGVVIINANNRAKMEAEFNRRRLVFPLTVAPGATRTGSVFYTMSPGPQYFLLQTSAGPVEVPLPFLRSLHLDPRKVPPPPPPKTDPALDP